jgi:hypothetical protein
LKATKLKDVHAAAAYKEELDKQKNELDRDKSEYSFFTYAGTVAVLLSWVWLLIALINGAHYYSPNRLIDNDKDQYPHSRHRRDGRVLLRFLRLSVCRVPIALHVLVLEVL